MGVTETISQMVPKLVPNNLHSTSGLIYITHQAMKLKVQV